MVRIYDINGRFRLPVIGFGPLAATDPTRTSIAHNVAPFESIWDDHGLACDECGAERPTLTYPDCVFVIFVSCIHNRGDDSDNNETANAAVGQLLPGGPDGYNPIAGNVLVVKLDPAPDLPRSAVLAPIRNLEPGDVAIIDGFVRTFVCFSISLARL
ncbi:hypothetical protein C8F01DRAFT_1170096 [Mycena amicta]|nr:hypothetical protein C8F01DRAFT_1170096 [Mycena amicta]